MQRAPVLALIIAATLSGCATPEARLRAGLINAGLPRPMAACMAERMVDRLSLAQLMRIADLPEAKEAESVPQFLRRVRALGDLEIVGVATSSAALCA
jgi:type IV pilus biogenesis protein CpaD/CtpE